MKKFPVVVPDWVKKKVHEDYFRVRLSKHPEIKRIRAEGQLVVEAKWIALGSGKTYWSVHTSGIDAAYRGEDLTITTRWTKAVPWWFGHVGAA